MVNPGSFRGARFHFLVEQKPLYAAAVVENDAGDALADIQRRYFKRFPIEHTHNVDPSPEWLASVDDDAPAVEPAIPNEDAMSPQEYEEAMKAYNTRKQLICFRKEVST